MQRAIQIVCVVVVVLCGLVNAAPVQWRVEDGGNGHWYNRVDIPTGLTWDQAKTDVETRSYGGVQGHLMTTTSQEEANLWETLYTGTPLPDAGKHRFWVGACTQAEPSARGSDLLGLQDQTTATLCRKADCLPACWWSGTMRPNRERKKVAR